jgi:hypothetical protein
MAILLHAAPAVLLTFISLSVIVIPILITVNLLHRLTSTASLPAHLPWAGVNNKGGPWSRLKASLTSVLDLKSLMNEGYTKVSIYKAVRTDTS